MLVKKTSSIQRTALSIPRALASRATQTRRAMFRTMKTMGMARNVLQQAQPASGAAGLSSRWATAVPATRRKGSSAGEASRRFRIICLDLLGEGNYLFPQRVASREKVWRFPWLLWAADSIEVARRLSLWVPAAGFWRDRVSGGRAAVRLDGGGFRCDCCVLVCWLEMMAGLAGVAGAQTGIYGEFTGAKVSAPNTSWMYGPTVGFYHDARTWAAGCRIDVRGTFAGRGRTNGRIGPEAGDGDGGVRLAVTPRVLPIKPYGEVLGGLGHLKTGAGGGEDLGDEVCVPVCGGCRLDGGAAGGLAGGGVQLWAAGWDGGQYAPKSLSMGIVFRLP